MASYGKQLENVKKSLRKTEYESFVELLTKLGFCRVNNDVTNEGDLFLYLTTTKGKYHLLNQITHY